MKISPAIFLYKVHPPERPVISPLIPGQHEILIKVEPVQFFWGIKEGSFSLGWTFRSNKRQKKISACGGLSPTQLVISFVLVEDRSLKINLAQPHRVVNALQGWDFGHFRGFQPNSFLNYKIGNNHIISMTLYHIYVCSKIINIESRIQ